MKYISGIYRLYMGYIHVVYFWFENIWSTPPVTPDPMFPHTWLTHSQPQGRLYWQPGCGMGEYSHIGSQQLALKYTHLVISVKTIRNLQFPYLASVWKYQWWVDKDKTISNKHQLSSVINFQMIKMRTSRGWAVPSSGQYLFCLI